MEEWSKDFFNLLETAASEIEQFFTEVAEEVAAAVDDFVQLSEEAAVQWQESLRHPSPLEALISEFDRGLEELVEPFLLGLLELETLEDDREPGQPDISRWQQPETCVGCCNYHGQVYGGNLLVCAMHPYGWDAEKCPDWEADLEDD